MSRLSDINVILRKLNYPEQETEPGFVDAYACPGGYPLFYLTADAGILCPRCVNCNASSVASAIELHDDPQWEVQSAEVNWEDDTLRCDNCCRIIESAYT